MADGDESSMVNLCRHPASPSLGSANQCIRCARRVWILGAKKQAVLSMHWAGAMSQNMRFSPKLSDVAGKPLMSISLGARREYNMISFINAITDKPDWHKKVFDNLITSKW
jgi:hypothetical protein